MNLENTENNGQTSCNICGGCCEKRGPVIYFDDQHIVERGKIPLKYLYTVREGEPFFDPKTGKINFTKSDIIRVKTKEINGETVCLLLNEKKCDLYETRPSECRAFKCWDMRQYEMIQESEDYLTRKHVLGEIEGLWDLISEHQERCSFNKIFKASHVLRDLIDNEKTEEQKKAIETLNDIYLFDKHVREVIKEKGTMDPEMIDFLFGKEIGEILFYYNLQVTEKDGKQYFSNIKI